MKKLIRSILTFFLIAALTVTASAATVTWQNARSATQTYLETSAKASTPIVGSVGGEWLVIGLARSGGDTSWKSGYYAKVTSHVTSEINASEQLDDNKSTDNSRIILALTALGYDVTNVAGHNLLKGITSMNYLVKQGINGPIWALIAFDSHNYTIPDGGYGTDNVTRDSLISKIISYQLADGGWDLAGKKGDPDMTAMAIQALAPYYSTKSNVKTAVNSALTFLSGAQSAGGGFASWGASNSESCAQVLTALSALKIDAATDSRFAKNSKTVIDNMLTFYVSGGGFAHVLESTEGYIGGAYNQMATEQAFYALTAYSRYKNSQKSLYDMTDVTITAEAAGIMGDVNGDGKINSTDAAITYACHNGKTTLTAAQLKRADVNGDGTVNSGDAAMIYAYHNGKLSKFPNSK